MDILNELEETPKTITGIAKIMKASWRYEVYQVGKFFLLHVQDFQEQYPYLILMSKTKWQGVTCLMWSKDCGGGE